MEEWSGVRFAVSRQAHDRRRRRRPNNSFALPSSVSFPPIRRRPATALLSHFADLVTSVLTDFLSFGYAESPPEARTWEEKRGNAFVRPLARPLASSKNFPVVQTVAVRDETAWEGRARTEAAAAPPAHLN